MTDDGSVPPVTGDGSAAPVPPVGTHDHAPIAPVPPAGDGSAAVAPAGGLCGTFTCGDSGHDDCGPCAGAGAPPPGTTADGSPTTGSAGVPPAGTTAGAPP